MTFEEMYDLLLGNVGVSAEALDLIFGINGCNQETAKDVLYFYTGWHTFEGWLSENEDC